LLNAPRSFFLNLGVPISFLFLYNPADLKEWLMPRRKERQKKGVN